MLAEPVRVGAVPFDTGSTVEGTVVRRKPLRILSRDGSLYVRVERIVSPKQTVTVAGFLAATETGAFTPPVLEQEGILRGRKPGLKNAVVDLCIAYALGKGLDDATETPIRSVASSMGHAAVANAARYFGMGASATFLVSGHGRDVRLRNRLNSRLSSDA